MPKPDIDLHNPSPDYLRSLIEGAGLSQRGVARTIGISERQLRYYLVGRYPCPYIVQYAIEGLQ